MKGFVKKNIKLLTILGVAVLFSAVGTTLALTLRFNSTSVSVGTANVTVNVRYDKDGSNNDITSITSTGDLIPIILDTSNINNVINSASVLKFKFWVSGDSSNPSNSIYDIVLNNITMDCELKNTYVKWLLYKNNTLLSSGNFSPTFDVMPNNRMILTSTQQDLTTTEDEYLLAMYIEESCSGNLSTCTNNVDQSSLLGRSFSANIGIETATKAKKNNTRTTGEPTNCTGDNTGVNKPECANNLVYNGITQNLLSDTVPTGVTINQSSAMDAGEYNITVKLNDGYKWADDDSTGNYILTCKINKRSITISTQNQVQGSFISSPTKVNVTNLVTGHTINSIHLSTISASGGDIISAGNAVIYDSGSNNVTKNYVINYQSTGKITES